MKKNKQNNGILWLVLIFKAAKSEVLLIGRSFKSSALMINGIKTDVLAMMPSYWDK